MSKDTRYTTEESILRRAQEAIGIPMGKINKHGRLNETRGAIGQVIEESWFEYTLNSDSRPDFPEAGIELKVTPYIKSETIRSKERLVCNIINYMEEYKSTFKTCSFMTKCHRMLLMFYEHKYGMPKSDFTIDKAILFSFPEEDLIIIEKDWNTIVSKIRDGQAHQISEGDTLYLAACTKGATAESVRKQPFSDIMAKQRAFSLKASYMTHILNSYVFGNEKCEKIITDWHVLSKNTFEDIIINKVSPYYGKTQEQLKVQFKINSSAKNINELILSKMLGINGKITKTDEFLKASIIPKTIRVQLNGNIKEHMSFPSFEFMDLLNQEWEDSDLFNYLSPTKFLFVIFKQNSNNEYIFEKVMFWNIPEIDLEEVHKVWQRTVDIIKNGICFTVKGNVVENNLPKQSESPVAHVRPHTSQTYYKFSNGRTLGNGVESNASALPDGRMMTKQSFWLNNSYIKKQIQR